MTNKVISQDIAGEARDHYQTFDRFYEHWTGSHNGGYHFGIAKKLSDIFHNSRMVRNTSNLVLDMLFEKGSISKVLDAGCGSGDVARLLAKRNDAAAVNISGITLSERQVAIGREKNTKEHVNNVSLEVGSFEGLPYSDASFDGAYFIDAICHGEGGDKQKALAEIARVLKSGGRLVLSDVFLQEDPKKMSRYFRYINDRINATWAVKEWAVEGHFMEAAKRLGLRKVAEKNLTFLIAPSVLHVPLIHLPRAAWKSIFDRSYVKEMKTLWNVSIFAILIGIHPNFRYKALMFEK